MDNRFEQKTNRLLVGVVSALSLIILSLAGYYFYVPISDYMRSIGFEPSEEVAEVYEHLGLTSTGKRILNASRPELQGSAEYNQNCPAETAKNVILGCYTNYRIYVYNIDNEELDGIKEAVMAHELLHAVWQRLSVSERDKLSADLRVVYKNNAWLNEHMESYSEDVYYDELHSIIGTQIQDSDLTPELRSHYDMYFNNRSQIVAYFNDYNDVFVKLQEESEELAAKIQQYSKTIEEKTKKYNEEYNSLSRDIDEFNARANSGYFSNAYAFNEARNKLISRQNALVKSYNELDKLVNSANVYVEKYNKIAIHVGELYDSIDSNLMKPEGSIKKGE